MTFDNRCQTEKTTIMGTSKRVPSTLKVQSTSKENTI